MKLATQPTEQLLTLTSLERACLAAHVAEENKGRDVLVLDMRGITPLYDFFVLATGASRRQIHTIAEEIDSAMHERGDARLSIEGYEASKWVVQDYGDVVVHVFDGRDAAILCASRSCGPTRRASIGSASIEFG